MQLQPSASTVCAGSDNARTLFSAPVWCHHIPVCPYPSLYQRLFTNWAKTSRYRILRVPDSIGTGRSASRLRPASLDVFKPGTSSADGACLLNSPIMMGYACLV